MSQTYGAKSKRYIVQRDEWLRSLQVKLTPAVEKLLREFYKAAVIAHEKRGDLKLEYCFTRLVDMSRMWGDDKITEVIGEHNSSDAAICLQQAVKCHATVLSLSTATPCRQQLEVPNIFKFFRSVIESTVSDLSEMRAHKEGGISVFGTQDTIQRKHTRAWIDQIVADKCLGIVPVGVFARALVPSAVSESLEEEEEVEEMVPAPTPKREEPEAPKKVEEPVVEKKQEPEIAKKPEEPVKIDPAVATETTVAASSIHAPAAEPKKEEEAVEVKLPAGEKKPAAEEKSDDEDDDDDGGGIEEEEVEDDDSGEEEK